MPESMCKHSVVVVVLAYSFRCFRDSFFFCRRFNVICEDLSSTHITILRNFRLCFENLIYKSRRQLHKTEMQI